MRVAMRVPVVGVPVAVMVALPEEEHRDEVDRVADRRDQERLVVVDGARVEQVLDAFDAEQQRDDREHDASRVPGERIDLAGAEAERVVAGARARVPVRDEREPERADVRAHVPAVGLERLGAGELSDHELAHHHHRRYRKGEITKLAEDAGYEIELNSPFNSLLFPPIAAVRLVGKLTGKDDSDDAMPSPLVNKTLDAVFGLERSLIGRVPMPFGVSLVAVLRRPRASA